MHGDTREFWHKVSTNHFAQAEHHPHDSAREHLIVLVSGWSNEQQPGYPKNWPFAMRSY